MVTPKEDKEAIDHALLTLVGRARRQAEDVVPDTEPDRSIRLSLFYYNIHEMIKNLLDMVEFEVDQNWGDDEVEEVDDLDMAGKPESESQEDEDEKTG